MLRIIPQPKVFFFIMSRKYKNTDGDEDFNRLEVDFTLIQRDYGG